MVKPASLINRLVSFCLLLTMFSSSVFITPNQAAAAVQPDQPPPQESELSSAEDKPEAAEDYSTSMPIQHTIYLKSREFVPETVDLNAVQGLAITGGDRMHVLLQLDFIPRSAAKAEFEARGIQLLTYIPDYAWIASVPAMNPARAMQQPGVTWVGALGVEDKLDPAIIQDVWGDYNLAKDGTAAVNVVLHPDVSLDAGRAAVAGYGGRITGEVANIHLLVVEMPRSNIRALAAEDIVQWIEQAAPPLTETNDGIRPQIGVDVLQASPYNLDGTGIDALVYDSGQAGNHVDFGARLTHGDADTVSDHSTHVAGILGGSGANSINQGGSALQWRGMAPNVDLISYGTAYGGTGVIFYQNVPDIESDWAQAQNTYGADLGTASLGSNIYSNYYLTDCDLMGNYGSSSVLIDQIVRGGNSTVGIGDKYITTWAAGNERGWGTSCAGAGGGYGIVAPPAGAKNPIHVGGSNTNNNTQYAHTSWGPTDDGRIKPIVTAGACQTNGDGGIKSTDNDPVNAYTVKCGTSMATPAVAGGIALMLQHYRDIYNTTGNFWPSTAKAILMQTADDFGNAGPDYQWGYGQVDIQAAVDLISRKAFRQESIASGEIDVYYFIVPNGANPATVSLAWDDYQATLNANPALINNLDLELVAPNGTLWRPWVLNPASPTTIATRGVDNRNNQEQVQVPTPEVGTWMVRVRGTAIPQGPQDYALACEGCKPLNLGVCQSTVDGTTMMATSNESLAETPTADAGSEDATQATMTPGQPSAGELWQRSLESVPSEGILSDTEIMLRQLNAAREQGPEAILALAKTLTGEARDMAMEEIVQAREEVLRLVPPPSTTQAVNTEDEATALSVQEATVLTNREQALTNVTDHAEGGQDTLTSMPEIHTPAAPAAVLTVGNGCTYATIAAAIAAANPGDVIRIEGGRTFAENITIPINLTVKGGYSGCASGSTARTTLDGNSSGPVVVVDRAIAVSLENLNITNGSTDLEGGGIRFAWGNGTGALNLVNIDIYANQGYWGGGLWVGPDADVTGDNVDIYNNTATAYGGGVRLYGGRVTFSNSNLHDNNAPYGGGIYATQEGGFAPVINLPTAADVHQNTATTGDGLGGGIYLRQGTVSLADCSDIYQNDALQGGGVYMITSTLTIGGSCSEIESNTATNDGGGIYAQGSTVNLDDDAELYANIATSGNGGGAYLDDSDLRSDRATIRYNTANNYGGGVYASNTSTVDMDIDVYTCLSVRCSQLTNNIASGAYGGGIYSAGSTIDLRNTFIELNTAVLGGGIYASASSTYIYNDVFAGNNATNNTGDGIRLYTGSTLNGTNNTLAYNDAGFAGTGRAISASGGTVNLSCSIIWGHTTSIETSGYNVTYSDIQGGYAGEGNLALNPMFVSTGSRDYHLQLTSPVIDRCLSGVTPDFENEQRPIVLNTAASPWDMGADEASGAARVGLNGAACLYPTIQQAINAAVDGDTLQIAGGVYFENLSISSKSLTLAGGFNSTCTAAGTSSTRIDGSARNNRVLYVYYSTLTLRNLELAWGSGSGAGLYANTNSHVTLDNADITENHGSSGGGLYISSNSIVTTTNGSIINWNTATSSGGAAFVAGFFSGTNNASDIHNNCAPNGGGFMVPGGHLSLNAADTYLNNAAAADGKGGGIYVTAGGYVTLTNAAYVYFLNRANDGGGIYADHSHVYLQGGSTTIRDNIATNYGGGLYLGNNSTLRSIGGRIGQAGSASIANEAIRGAGLYVANSTVDFSGSIQNNIASGYGGGIYATGSTLRLENTIVGGAGTGEANQLGTNGHYGAGMYLQNTQAALSDTVVDSNSFQTTGFTYGGGAFVNTGSVLTLTNSVIERHVAPSSGDGRGAGLYINGSTVTLDNSQVISNTAGAAGGGVRMLGTSTLNVLNNSLISNNESLNYEGGGIAAGGTPDINIADAILQGNRAGTDGGAVYLNNGTLNFTGGWTLRSNDADGNGGAVAVVGTADADFTAQKYSLFYDNEAKGGNGGAIYLNNNDTVQLQATNGPQLYIYANAASTNGGALYADNGGYFDIYGWVNVDHNWATTGHGGAIYLSNGSKAWLDDYIAVGPELWDNRAYSGNGGAIYASNSPSVRLDGVTMGRSGEGNYVTAGSGGAIYLSGSPLRAENCTFLDNQAGIHGGAIAAYTSTVTLQANYIPPAGTATIKPEQHDSFGLESLTATACDPSLGACSTLYNNLADSDGNNSGDGGAIYNSGGTLSINHTQLYTNMAYRGGAIYQAGASAKSQVNNSLIYSNTVNLALGAGIRSSDGAFTVTHVTIANNMGGAGYSQSSTTSKIHNSIAWGNSTGGFLGAFTPATCNIDQSGNAGPAVNPHFIAPGAGENYHLAGGSPAIDACPSGLTPDLDNISRPVGAAYDMGAYEYPHGMVFIPNRSNNGYTGATIQYTHRLTNTGSTLDTFTFTGVSSLGWALTLPSPVTLAAGTSTQVLVKVHVPPGAAVGTVDTSVIKATLNADPTLYAQVTDKTTVVCQPISGANFTFAPSSAIVHQPVVFTGTVAAGQIPILYTWNFGDSSAEETGNPIAHTFTTSNTFTVWMTATNTCPSTAAVSRAVVANVSGAKFIFLPLVVRNP